MGDRFQWNPPPETLRFGMLLLVAGPIWPVLREGARATGLAPMVLAVLFAVMSNFVVVRTLRREDPRAWRGMRPALRRLGGRLWGMLALVIGAMTLLTWSPVAWMPWGTGSGLERMPGVFGDFGAILELATRVGIGLAGSVHLLSSMPAWAKVGGRAVRLLALSGMAAAVVTFLPIEQMAHPVPMVGVYLALAWLQVEGVLRGLLPGRAPPMKVQPWVETTGMDEVRLVLPAAGAARDRWLIQQILMGTTVTLVGVGGAAVLEWAWVPALWFCIGGVWLLGVMMRWGVAFGSRTVVRFFPHRAEVIERMWGRTRTTVVEARRLRPQVVSDAAGPMLVLGDGVVVAADVPEAELEGVLNRIRPGLVREVEADANALRTALSDLVEGRSQMSVRGSGQESTRMVGLWLMVLVLFALLPPLALLGGTVADGFMWVGLCLGPLAIPMLWLLDQQRTRARRLRTPLPEGADDPAVAQPAADSETSTESETAAHERPQQRPIRQREGMGLGQP